MAAEHHAHKQKPRDASTSGATTEPDQRLDMDETTGKTYGNRTYTRTPIARRFWAKVAGGDYTTCWIWTASKDANGYGRFNIGNCTPYLAHRWAYEHLISPIPDSQPLDHLCRNPSCVNPWHLEPVTTAINTRRGINTGKSHCIHGHELTGENIYYNPANGHRSCQICRKISRDRRRPPKREAA